MNLYKKIFIATTLLVLTSCGISTELSNNTNNNTNSDTTFPATDPSISVSAGNVSIPEDGNSIHLKDSGSSTNSSNVIITGDNIEITEIGEYYITGSLSNGSILITATVDLADISNDTVVLNINGVSLTSSTKTPINSTSDAKLKIRKVEGSTNIITDNRTRSTDTLYDYNNNGEGAIFSNKRMDIIGHGTLQVKGLYNHGLQSDKTIGVKNGKLYIQAYNEAIRSDVGIHVGEYDEQTNALEGGYVQISTTTGHGLFSNVKTNDVVDERFGIYVWDGELIINAIEGDAIKSETDVYIKDGNLTLSTSNYYVAIQDQEIEKAGNGDAIQADYDLTIDGGNINVVKSYKGFKALNIYINGGTHKIVSEGDGIATNILAEMSSSIESTIVIAGGVTSILSFKDGMQLEKGGEMTGGTLAISSGTVGIKSDFNNFIVTGGTLFGQFNHIIGRVNFTGTQIVKTSYLNVNTTSNLVEEGSYYVAKLDGTNISHALQVELDLQNHYADNKPAYELAAKYMFYSTPGINDAYSIQIGKCSNLSGQTEIINNLSSGGTSSDFVRFS